MKQKAMVTTTTIILLLLANICHYSSSKEQSEVISSQYHQSISSAAHSINELGFSLTKRIGGSGNFIISPLSISVALAMAYLGARGQTAEQMEIALGYRSQNMSVAEVHEGFRKLITSLQSGGNEYSLLVANAMFLQQNFKIKDEFVAEMVEYYQSVVNFVDFSTNGKETVEEINRWVDQNTGSKIKKLFETPLDPMTRLLLLNAVYFKGTWKIQFPKGATQDGKFYKDDGSTKDVKLMTLSDQTFSYYVDSQTEYKFLELPYKGSHISMLLALPWNSAIPNDLVLTNDILNRVNQRMIARELRKVVIPKFKIEYKRNLKGDLEALGMSDLFTGRADLTGITEVRDLFVSQVIHKAVIEVNEEGSEAAAVTGVGIRVISAPPSFEANRPFQFVIIDKRSGAVLFAGRVSDP